LLLLVQSKKGPPKAGSNLYPIAHAISARNKYFFGVELMFNKLKLVLKIGQVFFWNFLVTTIALLDA